MGRRAKNKQNQLSQDMMDATNAQLEKFNNEQAAQRKLLERQKKEYKEFEFVNPYQDMQNPLATLQTEFENVYEDVTVDMRAAEFQQQMARQQRADILSTLSGAAGGRFSGDIDLYIRGKENAALVAEVKARANGEGFKTIETWLGENDLMFLWRDRKDPLVVLPFDNFVEIVNRSWHD